MIKTILVMLSIGLCWPALRAQSSVPNSDVGNSSGSGVAGSALGTTLQGTPSASSVIRLRAGQIDGVTGDLALALPVGPRLPGRIPLGISWNFNASAGDMEQGTGLYPLSWPSPELPNPQITMWFNGRQLRFLKQASPTSGMPSVATVVGWLQKRKVLESVLSQLSAGAGVYASADGTRFLLVSTATPTAMAVVDGEQAIWTADTLGNTRVSHVTNLWGDDVSITEENFASRMTPMGPLTPYQAWPGLVTIRNANGPTHTITLSIAAEGTAYCPFTFTVSNSMGLPSASSSGILWGHQRSYLQPNGTFTNIYGEVVPQYINTYLPHGDLVFLPDYFRFSATDGSTQTISLNWTKSQDQVQAGYAPCGTPASQGLVNVQYSLPILNSITYPDGLVESLAYSRAVSLAGNSFDPITGKWKGWGPSSPDNSGVQTSSNQTGSPVGAVSRVTFTGAGVDQSVVIAHLWPKSIWSGTRSWPQPKHETAVLYFATSTPGAGSPYRGVRLVHPNAGTWSSVTDQQAYLFATSAVLKMESIYGVGVPTADTVAPWSYQIPAGFTVYDTALYENWESLSWGNPSGILTGTGGLPVNARATKLSHYPANLPVQVQISSEWDAYGPIGWHGRVHGL